MPIQPKKEVNSCLETCLSYATGTAAPAALTIIVLGILGATGTLAGASLAWPVAGLTGYLGLTFAAVGCYFGPAKSKTSLSEKIIAIVITTLIIVGITTLAILSGLHIISSKVLAWTIIGSSISIPVCMYASQKIKDIKAYRSYYKLKEKQV